MTYPLLLAALLLTACGTPEAPAEPEAPASEEASHDVADAPEEAPPAEEQSQFGTAFTVVDAMPVGTVIADPTTYVGQNIRVEGTIVDVCEMAGCWLTLGTESGEVLRVKVNDGDMVFPVSSRGKSAEVEGELSSYDLTVEQLIERGAHIAEEQGTTFDPGTVTGPETIYQIYPKAVQIAS